MDLISKMPYGKKFLFVDEIQSVDEKQIKGSYQFSAEAEFYQDHFPSNPITPGVFLIECAAQIGLVAFGIYLLEIQAGENQTNQYPIAFTSSQVDFLKPVTQGEEIFVEAKKIYFRFHKLKVNFQIYNSTKEIVAQGELAGMFQLKKIKNE